KSVLIFDLDHLIDHLKVEHAGNETGSDALDFVFAGFQLLALHFLGDNWAGNRLDGDSLETRFALLDDLADAGDGAAGADAGYEDVCLAVGVGPDFLGRGAAMNVRVGRVLNL